MDALILAGGQAPPELVAATGCSDRALIELDGQPMIGHVLAALRDTPGIDRIAVVGAPELAAKLGEIAAGVTFVESSGRMVDNAITGLRAIGAELTLITTCDVPMVTSATFQEMIEGFQRQKLEAAYAICSRQVCEKAFPTGQRTYAKLQDGDFTAGNAVIVPGSIVERLAEVFDTFYRARKNPVAMAKLLSTSLLVKYLTRRLSVQGAECKMAELLGCNAGAVQMLDATIAFDIDKPDDLRVAREAFALRN